jgi:hypothetical protein
MVLSGAPRTTNNVESWHGQLTANERKHQGIFKTIEIIRLEQGLPESTIVEQNKGQINSKNKLQCTKDP